MVERPRTWRERRLTALAVVTYPILKRSIRTKGPGRCSRALARVPRGRALPTELSAATYANEVGRAAQRAGEVWKRADRSCLTASIFCWWLLERRGLQPEFRIGIPKSPGPFVAHAWVEMNGVVISEPLSGQAGHEPFIDAVDPRSFGHDALSRRQGSRTS